MAQATVSRRRPCRRCGGRYFVGTVTFVPAVIAIALAFGGIAKAVLGSGFLDAVGRGIAPAAEHLALSAAWAFGGIVLAAVVAFLGHGYRCIGCDTRQ